MNKATQELKPWTAFKNFAIVFSFIINFIILLSFLFFASSILPLLSNIIKPTVAGMNRSLIQLSAASIKKDIVIDQVLPIEFNVPIDTRTVAKLKTDLALDLRGKFVVPKESQMLNGDFELVLPKDMEIPVAVSLEIPVQQEIRILLTVPINVPLGGEVVPDYFLYELSGQYDVLDNILNRLPQSRSELFQQVFPEAEE